MLATEKSKYNYKTYDDNMKHTELVEFSFHFKKEKFQRYALEVVKCSVFCSEKQTSLIRLIGGQRKRVGLRVVNM